MINIDFLRTGYCNKSHTHTQIKPSNTNINNIKLNYYRLSQGFKHANDSYINYKKKK